MCTCAGSSRPQRSIKLSRFASINILLHLLALTSIILIVLGPSVSTCLPISEFFPFNSTFGDLPTERDDDGGSGQINLTVKFPFFGRHHDKLFVNNNGIITFIKGLRTYRPGNFPLAENTPIIAVYWADVDTAKSGGNVWYQEYRHPDILAKAQREIRNYQFAYRNYRAYWVFVATWDDVGFYGAKEEGLNKKNTFQVVLVLDNTGKKSFVILNYGKIEWTTGSNSQGDSITGLGGNPAQAGFNAGDGIHYYEIEGARTGDIVNLTQTSNVGVPGKWIFRIDSASIQEACSSSDHGELNFWPTYASMLGGDILSVNGPCFSEGPSIVGRITDTGQEFCCYAVHSTEAKCVMPPVFRTGRLAVSLNVGNQGWNFTGAIEFKNVIDTEPGLVRQGPHLWFPGATVEVAWRDGINVTQASNYLVELLEYRVVNGIPEFHPLYSQRQSSIQNRRVQIKILTTLDIIALAVVRVTALVDNCENLGPYVYSDVFPLQPKTSLWAESLCSNWMGEQSLLPSLRVQGHCPCTIAQGEGDTGQFVPDPLCNKNSDWLMNCKYRSPLAGECLIPNEGEGTTTASYVCCYDKTSGELLNPLEGHGGGTTERYSIRMQSSSTPDTSPTSHISSLPVIPYFSYMQYDVGPFLYCCTYSSNKTMCDEYLKMRSPVGCQGYESPSCAQGSGDPHLDSLDGQSFTFNGLGEFMLLRVKDAESVIQVRTALARSQEGELQNATVFTGVALRASNTSSVVEILLDNLGTEPFTLLVDGQPTEISAATSNFNGITVYTKTPADSSVGNTAAPANTAHGSTSTFGITAALPTTTTPTPTTTTTATTTTPITTSTPVTTRPTTHITTTTHPTTISSTTGRNSQPTNSFTTPTPKHFETTIQSSIGTRSSSNSRTDGSITLSPHITASSNPRTSSLSPTTQNNLHSTDSSRRWWTLNNRNSSNTNSNRPTTFGSVIHNNNTSRHTIRSESEFVTNRAGSSLTLNNNYSNNNSSVTLRTFSSSNVVTSRNGSDKNNRSNSTNKNHFYNRSGVAGQGNISSNRTSNGNSSYNRNDSSSNGNSETVGNNILNRLNPGSFNFDGDTFDENNSNERKRRKRRQTLRTGSDKEEITLVADSRGLSVLVEVTPDLLNVMVIAGPQLKGRVEGLLGNFNDDATDDLVSREGLTLSPSATMREIHFKFGMSWHVPHEDSIFTPLSDFDNTVTNDQSGGNGNGTDKDTYTPIFLDELEGNGLRSDTVQICGDNVQCQFDYLVTGKESIAVSTLKFSNKFEERRKEIQPVVRCPFVRSVANGNRTLLGQKVGDQAIIICHEGFQLSNKSGIMTCKDSGSWDQPTPACVEVIDTDEEIPILYIAVGSAVGAFLLLVVICLVISCLCRRCPERRASKKVDSWSELEAAIELPTIFPISDIPSAVFENPIFVNSLHKLSEKGTFRIPRPTFVDPNIYTEYF